MKGHTMTTISKFSIAALLALASTTVSLAHAARADTAPRKAADTANAASMSEGEIKKVDKHAGKLTIKHGELKNLSMPPMTMVFKAKDQAMLDAVKAGDKVNFVAENVGGQFTVTQIEPKK
jgi:Cu(I)/Ag(I) efflux system periplasmic protein CusF